MELYRGSQFSLIPFGDWVRNGTLRRGESDGEIFVLPVLVSFADSFRVASPSQNTLAALSGMRKANVAEALKRLEARNWLITSKERRGRRFVHAYTLTFEQYRKGGAQERFVKIYYTLVRNGLWAIMPPAAKKLLIVLMAHSLPGHVSGRNFERMGIDWREVVDEAPLPYAFLPQERISPGRLAEMAGLPERSFRFAKCWLFRNRMVREHEPEQEYPGWIVRLGTTQAVPGLFDRLEKMRLEEMNRNQNRSKPEAAREAETQERDPRIVDLDNWEETPEESPGCSCGNEGTVKNGNEGTATGNRGTVKEENRQESGTVGTVTGNEGTANRQNGNEGTATGSRGTATGNEGTGSYYIAYRKENKEEEGLPPPSPFTPSGVQVEGGRAGFTSGELAQLQAAQRHLDQLREVERMEAERTRKGLKEVAVPQGHKHPRKGGNKT